jgi:hypothetical protein
MFRFGARAAPQAAFACGARSAMYMGQVYSRRHFARTNSPLLAGFIDPARVLAVAGGSPLVAGCAPALTTVAASLALEDALQAPIGFGAVELCNAVDISAGFFAARGMASIIASKITDEERVLRSVRHRL